MGYLKGEIVNKYGYWNNLFFMFYIDFYLFDGNYGKICILEYLFIENILFKLKWRNYKNF